MSIADRRNSLSKSSIGIDSIRKSITSLSEGLVAIGNKSRELLKETRKTNQYKRKLIRQDGEFFKRRRENALRRQREDELEASTITGVTKRQGSLVQKSTRGFLGRILDFLGILLLGWAITNLPKIIAAFQKLFGLIQRVVGVLGGFISGMKNFLVGIGTGIDNFLDIFRKFNFGEDDKKIKDTLETGQNNLTKLNKDFVEGSQLIANDKDIASATQVAEDLGIDDTGDTGDVTGVGGDFTPPVEDDDEEVETFSAEEVEILNQGGTLEDVEAGVFTPITQEDIERERALDAEENAADNVQGVNTVSDEETLEEVLNDAENVEGVGGEEEAVTPAAGSGANVTGADANLEGALQNKAEEFDTGDDKGKIDPVREDKSSSLTPVKKSRNNLRGRRRRRQTIVQVNNQGGGSVNAPTMSGGTKTETIVVGNSSQKTLLDLQSLNNKHN